MHVQVSSCWSFTARAVADLVDYKCELQSGVKWWHIKKERGVTLV
jgi:hypothetical protein